MITMNHHPLHTNEWFAEHETVQGRNVVVGNLVYSLVLGMSVPDVSGAAIANLEVETLQHKHPTFHGDTIYAETRVLEVKESTSKPDRGIVTVETKGFNQDGKEVCYFRRRVMVWKREAAPDRQRPVRRAEAWGERVTIHPAAAQRVRRLPGRARTSGAGRPTPTEAVEGRRSRCGIGPHGRRVLDLAAGTGKFTRLLARSGRGSWRSSRLRRCGAELVAQLPEVRVLGGTAEAHPACATARSTP